MRSGAGAGDVGDVLPDSVEVGGVDALARHPPSPFVAGFRTLHPAGAVLDQVVLVHLQELVAQDRDLRLDLRGAKLVLEQEALELVPHPRSCSVE